MSDSVRAGLRVYARRFVRNQERTERRGELGVTERPDTTRDTCKEDDAIKEWRIDANMCVRRE